MYDRKKNTKSLSCWVITEGMAGTENQCLGVCDALNITPTIKHVKLRFLWRYLSPYFRIFKKYAFTGDSDSFTPPFPDIVIASGRKSIIAALYIKEASKGKTTIIQIQDPRCNPKLFDLVAIPAHDPTRGKNIIVTTAALHRVTKEILEKAKTDFIDFTKFPNPKIAVLIGGNSKSHQINEDISKEIAKKLKKLSHNYSLFITASRRTPENCQNIIKNYLNDQENIFFWNGEGKNPYFAFLAYADIIIVTEDSVSMTSEAISTGKSVYIMELEKKKVKNRIDKFHDLLQNLGYTKKLPNIIDNHPLKTWKYKAPHDTLLVADEIIKIIKIKKREANND